MEHFEHKPPHTHWQLPADLTKLQINLIKRNITTYPHSHPCTPRGKESASLHLQGMEGCSRAWRGACAGGRRAGTAVTPTPVLAGEISPCRTAQEPHTLPRLLPVPAPCHEHREAPCHSVSLSRQQEQHQAQPQGTPARPGKGARLWGHTSASPCRDRKALLPSKGHRA